MDISLIVGIGFIGVCIQLFATIFSLKSLEKRIEKLEEKLIKQKGGSL